MCLYKRKYFFIIRVMLMIGLCEGKKVMNGRYTRNIKDFELLVPHKVDQLGSFLSFHLPSFFAHNFAANRWKRDFNHYDAVYYNLHFNGIDHKVELLPNHGFVSPNFAREAHYRDEGKSLKGRRFTTEPTVMCHYTGRVQKDERSRAALSACNGLTGYVETSSGKYFIEPVDGHGANEDGHLLHVIHNVDTRSVASHFCGTTDWKKGWEKALSFHQKRFKRSESKHRFLELMVVADKAFLKHHKSDDVETYILTIMNMVSDFYHDASSGHQMDVVVVRIVKLEEDNPIESNLSSDASKTLRSFCKWQSELNPKDHQNPHHHDSAILLTRQDICMDNSCDLLGLANVASVCVPKDSCAINEDNGLMLGVTVTHEIGHLMGCDHDDGQECSSDDEHKLHHVMSPKVSLATGQWSNCSKRFMHKLFDNKLGDCLNDEPKDSAYKLDDSLPGTIYDADFQCRMMFGDKAKVCPSSVEKVCELLMCQIGDKCRSNGSPAADGTSCGSNKWCMKKYCVRIGKRGDDAIAGGWGDWGDSTECSRHCGGGVHHSERDCTNPIPKNGGRYCLGERKRYEVCNTKPCPPGEMSFRQQQCEGFNDSKHNWTPHLKKTEMCALFCKNEKLEVHRKSVRVKDGTFCMAGSNDMCIAGECKNVGCDWKLNSHVIDDQCGICDGDGTGCNIVNGTLDVSDEDTEISISFPLNSRIIVVKKLAPSESRLQLADPKTKANFLKDYHWGEVNVGGAIGVMTLPEAKREEIYIQGPLKMELLLRADYKKDHPVMIFYQFAAMKELNEKILEVASAKEKVEGPFMWDYLVPDGHCDARCDSGTLQTPAVCVSKDGEQPNEMCERRLKPPSKIKPCNTHPCTFKWQIGKWSECSLCPFKASVQRRKVWCGHESRQWDEKPLRVDDDKCSDSDSMKPPIKRLCSTECTRKCGVNRSTRAAHDFVELFKNLNVIVLEPSIFVLPNVSNESEPCCDQHATECSMAKNKLPEIESLPGNNDELTTKSIKSPEMWKYFMVHPVMMRHSSKRINRHERKARKGQVWVDKIPDDDANQEVSIKKQHEQSLSDNAFRKLGDKLGKTLDVKHAIKVEGSAGKGKK